jgi:hypothetical protein
MELISQVRPYMHNLTNLGFNVYNFEGQQTKK